MLVKELEETIDHKLHIDVLSDQEGLQYEINPVEEEKGLVNFKLKLSYSSLVEPKPVVVKWKFPSLNVKGVWKTSIDRKKRIQYDWELEHLKSRISVDAPVVSVFGHDDSNICTFACLDAINLTEMNALLREEDNHVHCFVKLFSERHPIITEYEIDIRVDYRKSLFSEALGEVSKWWETNEGLKPTHVPDIAKAPLYSTWYQYHQSLDVDTLIAECKIASKLGYKLIILDDGWQTMDSNRGYDYTGDWFPERIPQMKEFVDQIHNLGMKFGLWFSVPFCGKKSKAYEKFKGKFLTENNRWAPVFDPRYPEVREHLINIYTTAIQEWRLDGFKLDFIDDFTVYPETVLTKENGRDYASVNEGVDRLMTDVITELQKINPEVFIEFRQQYIGPAMRKFGNMFRAFDCPNDSNTNRVRIADVRLLCGNSAVHADPFTWNMNEPVEIAALQMVNAIFGVPQLSVELAKAPEDHIRMIQFYTNFWNENRDTLMDGTFLPSRPLTNYPILKSTKDGHMIIGVFDDVVVELDQDFDRVDILNGKWSESVAIKVLLESFNGSWEVYDCMGDLISEEDVKLMEVGLHEIYVPKSGMIKLRKY
ncbi:MAG: alpha-galactosidase [Cyclobacteriaceae bacterium]